MSGFRLSLVVLNLLGVLASDAPLFYSPAPDDTYWSEQWYLDNRDTNGAPFGLDMNVRGAWPFSTGAGVNIAIVDDGVDLAHPDLAHNARPDLHWNFESDTPDGLHPADAKAHGTAVAGLAAAEANNARGISGIAPAAGFASWVIYKTNNTGGPFVSSNQLAKMFTFHTNDVQIQNHSWVKPAGDAVVEMSAVENAAIQAAVTGGRQGRGVVMIRAGGNDRLQGRNANDDQYINDPRVIAVGALRSDGIFANYSNPGAPILVSAPGGEEGFISLFTTDRVGSKGFNRIGFTNDLADYVFASLGFVGTSAAAPLISGTVGLMLSRNPALGYRDVQQILLLTAHQTNPQDPDVQTNGAGLLVGHNLGYGLADAAAAVDLAAGWSNRPALSSSVTIVEKEAEIPDSGLTLAVEPIGGEQPNLLIGALPSLGIHVNGRTAKVPLVYVGDAAVPLQLDLTGKAALIQRGATNFATKIGNAAQAGALFAIVFNNQGTNEVQVMGGTDLVPIPAISISQEEGERLTNIVATFGADAWINFATVGFNFDVSDSLLCEHVKVTLKAAHQQRGDLRVTLVSPSGTRSVLQRFGRDLNPFPGEWTYTSTHHFYESSQGAWRLLVGDEALGGTGSVHSATLEILGVPIKDSDRDGLDDDWELSRFGSLEYGPTDDPDLDGRMNSREQILFPNGIVTPAKLALNLSIWNDSTLRLNWPSRAGIRYEVLTGNNVLEPLAILGEVAGEFPRTDFFTSHSEKFRYFLVREKQ